MTLKRVATVVDEKHYLGALFHLKCIRIYKLYNLPYLARKSTVSSIAVHNQLNYMVNMTSVQKHNYTNHPENSFIGLTQPTTLSS
jgi:hypothetical protein